MNSMSEDTLLPVGTRDTRLIERAMRERWPISPEYRKRIVQRLLLIALGRNSKGEAVSTSNREITSAIRALAQLDQINMEAEKEVLPQQHVHLHGDIDLDKIDMADLKGIERQLLELSRGAGE